MVSGSSWKLLLLCLQLIMSSLQWDNKMLENTRGRFLTLKK